MILFLEDLLPVPDHRATLPLGKPCHRRYFIPVTISQALKNAIEHDTRSLTGLMDDSGVNASIVSRLLRDERSCTLETADRLLDALGLECSLLPMRRKGDK